MATLKITHTVDWQLGKPFVRFPAEAANVLSEAHLDAIDRMASVAAGKGARYVLAAGVVLS